MFATVTTERPHRGGFRAWLRQIRRPGRTVQCPDCGERIAIERAERLPFGTTVVRRHHAIDRRLPRR